MRSPRSSGRSRRIAIASVVALCSGAAAGAAYASELPSQTSTNWAGYAAITGSSTREYAKHFNHVSGTWVEPTATCTPAEPTFSAFWVGLGGYKQTSKALEQVGSEADCTASGQVSYYAWYEYVPQGPNTIGRIAVSPGDEITATVTVKGERATVTLTDLTTGATFKHTRKMRSPKPDVSAAEWIAEAPSACTNNRCTPLTLTNFGSLTFTNATATSVGTDGRQTGVIDDSDWIYGAIDLESTNSRGRFNQNEPSEATTGTLAATGDSFSVTYGSGATGASGSSGSSGTTGVTGAT
ncbi:MAG: G1 family glutamic endopeptidase [Solirubrobacteraceae bacterium]|jgi:hypothetical protein